MASKPPTLRLHLEERSGVLRSTALVVFGADASLYVVPYSINGEYWYGESAIPAGQQSFEVKFREQIKATARPKLSVHWSGDVHIYAKDDAKAGPLKTLPLAESRGEHIASVQFDHVERLPVYARRTKTRGEKIDVAFGVPPDTRAGRLLLYANGERNLFQTEHVHFAQRVERPDGTAVWFGFTAVADDPLGSTHEGGVTVLAGFDARKPPMAEQHFLFLRGL